MKNLLIFSLFPLLIITLTGCDVGPNPFVNNPDLTGSIAGFWDGLLNGVFLPFNLLVSLFDNTVSIYNVYNNGNLYNLGFVLGAAMTLGGSSSSMTTSKKKVN
jgi:hypothetical protein